MERIGTRKLADLIHDYYEFQKQQHLSARWSGRACSCFNQKTTACPESPVSVYQSPTIELMQH